MSTRHVAGILRRQADASLRDVALLQERASLRLPGGVHRSVGEWDNALRVACRIAPESRSPTQLAVVADRDEQLSRFVVGFSVAELAEAGYEIEHGQRMLVTSTEFGWTKTLIAGEVLDRYSDQVQIKVFCTEEH